MFKNFIFAALALVATFAAAPAWAVYCPVTPSSLFSSVKAEPTPLQHSVSGGPTAEVYCTQGVQEAREKGLQLPTQEQFMALVRACAGNCVPWKYWKTLPSASTQKPKPKKVTTPQAPKPVVKTTPPVKTQKKKVVKTTRPPVEAQVAPAKPQPTGMLCWVCKDQHGNWYMVTPNGVAIPVARK